jgi:hypothetical protein
MILTAHRGGGRDRNHSIEHTANNPDPVEAMA